MEVTITNENFESYKNGELPLVVDFGATWCGPCRMVAPIVDGIRNIPSILFFKGGKVVDKLVGAVPKAKIKEKFEAML